MSGAYEYIIQDAANFKRWLDWGKLSYAVELTRYREIDHATGSYFIRREPPHSDGKSAGSPVTSASPAQAPAAATASKPPLVVPATAPAPAAAPAPLPAAGASASAPRAEAAGTQRVSASTTSPPPAAPLH
jgi:hypothetical protein